jgi:hypothetical protein
MNSAFTKGIAAISMLVPAIIIKPKIEPLKLLCTVEIPVLRQSLPEQRTIF